MDKSKHKKKKKGNKPDSEILKQSIKEKKKIVSMNSIIKKS